jgi:intein/homing endonuclease
MSAEKLQKGERLVNDKERLANDKERLATDDYIYVFDAYFNKDQYIHPFVEHHINSFDNLLDKGIEQIIAQKNPIVVEAEYKGMGDVIHKNLKLIRHIIEMRNIYTYMPHCSKIDGSRDPILPNECRLLNQTYSADIYANVVHEVVGVDSSGSVIPIDKYEYKEPIKIGAIPIPLRSRKCITFKMSPEELLAINEDPLEWGGYFIVRGGEYCIISQEQKGNNHIYLNKKEKNGVIDYEAFVQSKLDEKFDFPYTTKVKIDSKNEINVVISTGAQTPINIPLVIMMRALGVVTDEEICQMVMHDTKDREMAEILKVSILKLFKETKAAGEEEAKGKTTAAAKTKYIKITTQETALVYIAHLLNAGKTKVMEKVDAIRYTTYEVIEKTLLPHLGGLTASRLKAFYIAYMARIVIDAKRRIRKVDDKDNYGNKRILTSGPEMAQLVRFYYNQMIKDLKASIYKEISSKTFATQDIQNMVFRLLKYQKFENGIRQKLNIGEWPSGSKAFNNKKGISQRMERKSRMDTLSFLRRCITQVQNNKSNKNQDIHKLHNSHWGYICVDPETEVLMEDGTQKKIKYIKDKYNTQRVITVNRDSLEEESSGLCAFQKVSAKELGKKVYKITVPSGRTIIASEDHKFHTSKGYIEIGKLNEGDLLLVRPINKSHNDDINEKNSIILTKEDYITFVKEKLEKWAHLAKSDAEEMEKIGILPLYENDLRLPIIARIVGCLMTDGSCSREISFCCGNEKDIDNIQRDINSIGFQLKGSKRYRERKGFQEHDHHTWELAYGGSVARFFKAIGTPQGRYSEMAYDIPKWIVNGNKSVKRNFLGAYLGGDGGCPSIVIRKDGEVNFNTCKIQHDRNPLYEKSLEKLMSELSEMFNEFGVKTISIRKENVKSDKKQKIVKDRIRMFLNLGSSIDNIETIIDQFTFYYDTFKDTKVRLTNEFVKCKKNGYKPSANKFKRAFDTGMIYMPIIEKEEIDRDILMDFTTKSDNHNFVANGFVISNCPVNVSAGKSEQ